MRTHLTLKAAPRAAARMYQRVRLGALIAVLLCVSLAGAGAATFDVHIYDFDFSANPSGQPVVDPTINLGDTIHWVWDSGFHSTTAAAGQLESWNSGVHSPAFAFDHTFTQLGTFNYFCSVHGFDAGGGNVGGMSGSITVVPEPTTGILMLMGLGLVGVWLRRRQ